MANPTVTVPLRRWLVPRYLKANASEIHMMPVE